ncbi:beta-xylosidase [Caulobacter sp.]|uniref:GH39 family glycosyl hydrolase n=1 Tax=Caulobacter sp. TaxID=78 RepID=UPI001B16316A|nr:beta-xylosidase [Caulobacter sp.]MBO9544361.1 beta-xylosidase [Caulobacter sp.]
MRKGVGLGLLAALSLTSAAFAQTTAPLPVSITVDAGKPQEELRPIWRFFGADEPNYATMKDGRKLLGHLGALKPKAVYFRTHNLLNTGDGTPALKWGSTNVYTEDAQGKPIYNWTILDHLFDTYLAAGVRPYVQIGFMPKALSTNPEPYQHAWRPGFDYNLISGGWGYPPKDYDKWSELAYQWVRHCIERYGQAEVETWYFEVWNEPNGPAYWKGTPQEFHKLHDYAIAGVRRALPTARVGGPDVAGSGGQFMEDFLTHVADGTNYATGQKGTPTDFLAFHAKGSPKFVDGHVQMGIANQLAGIDKGFSMIAARPALKDKPIVIGESDPEGCAACQGPSLSYRNGTVYSSYTAASFARKHDLAKRRGVTLDGALTWAFEFEDQPYFAGFRQLSSNGLDLAVVNVFRMFSLMGPRRIEAVSSGQIPLDEIIAQGVRGRPDVGALASLDKDRVAIMVWNYHDDDVPGPAADVTLDLKGLPKGFAGGKLTHYRVDQDHGNVYGAWQRMGSPMAPTKAQYDALEAASGLAVIDGAAPTWSKTGATLTFQLPRQGVSLLVLERLKSQ